MSQPTPNRNAKELERLEALAALEAGISAPESVVSDVIELLKKENRMDVYHRFIEEVDALTIKADWSAVKTVGELTRAVKRAQMVYDGDRAPVSERGEPVGGEEA